MQTDPQHILKYCPKCGSKQFIFQSSNSFLCEECNFHLFVNSSAAVAAIIVDREGKIMLTRRACNPSKGMLDLPGGFVDAMESAEDAIRRELKEELDVTIESLEYFTSLPNRYVFSGITVFTTDLVFICSIDRTENLTAMDDISEVLFFDLDKIPLDDIAFPSLKIAVEKFIKKETINRYI